MSKVVLNDVANGYNVSVINQNFNKIEEALNDKVLYRDNPVGEPNELKNDLDVNGNKLYNVDTLYAQRINLGGITLDAGDPVTSATIQRFQYTATEGLTNFSISPFTGTVDSVIVAVNGLLYPASDYTVLGSVVTLPPCQAGDEVDIRVFTKPVS